MNSWVPLEANATVVVAQDVGTFIWDVIADCLRGDREVAEFFGLPEDLVSEGLGIDHFLSQIVPEDRDRTAAAIHAAIVSGQPYQAEYRVKQQDGEIVTLTAMGRCFLDKDGLPLQYCGLIFKSAKAADLRGMHH